MAGIDLDDMSISDLRRLDKQVADAIAGRRKSEVLSQLEARARELGYDLAALTGVGRPRKSAEKGVPRYRHPENSAITWTGRGRKPDWFHAALASGRSAKSLEV